MSLVSLRPVHVKLVGIHSSVIARWCTRQPMAGIMIRNDRQSE